VPHGFGPYEYVQLGPRKFFQACLTMAVNFEWIDAAFYRSLWM
jgi:hypothetical protein